MSAFFTEHKVSPVRTNTKFNQDKLVQYLRANVDLFPKTGQVSISKFAFGQSNPTYLLQCNQTKFVLRKKPDGKLLPSAHAIDREYRVMSALQNTKVPVAKTFIFCKDKSIIGTEFYLCEFINGRVFLSGTLETLNKHERHAVYNEYCRVIAEIHSVNIHALNLTDFGGSGRYLKRQKTNRKNINIYDHCARLKAIWNSQFKRAETAEVAHMPMTKKFFAAINEYVQTDNNEIETLVHGDYHFANIIWHPTEIRILAVVDWELSTIGNPMNDVATCALVWYYHSQPLSIGFNTFFKGHFGTDCKQYGIPTEFEFLKAYIQKLSIGSEIIKKMDFPIKDWNYYVALQLHRYIGVFQGIHKRNVIGTASNPSQLDIISCNEYLAQRGLYALNQIDIFERKEHIILPLHLETFKSRFSDSFYTIYRELIYFMDAYIYPNEKKHQLWLKTLKHQNKNKNVQIFPLFKKLKQKAKELGLWNIYLKLTNFEYCTICEILGRSPLLAPVATNCDAPNVPNVYILRKYATNKQKEKYLQPLLEGTISSCYAMTEPDIASSDAKNIKCSIIKTSDNKYYIINGRKWWTTGAIHPNCTFTILMGKLNDKAGKQQTMLIIPMNCAGIKIVRQLNCFGYEEGHCEIIFNNVCVSVTDSLLGEEGAGFEIAQVRLSPARVHHCMRFVGMSEKALSLMKNRTLSRFAFGKSLASFTSIQHDIANSRMDIDKVRLLIFQTACMMDKYGIQNYDTRQYISMIKNAVCNACCNVIDKAIQIYGGSGVSQDTDLPYFYVLCRCLRIGDGPDAVHHRVVAKIELNYMAKL